MLLPQKVHVLLSHGERAHIKLGVLKQPGIADAFGEQASAGTAFIRQRKALSTKPHQRLIDSHKPQCQTCPPIQSSESPRESSSPLVLFELSSACTQVSTLVYCTVLYCAVLYCTLVLLYCAVLCCTVLYCGLTVVFNLVCHCLKT